MINILKIIRCKQSSEVASYIRRGKQRPRTKIQIGSKTYNFQLKSQQYYQDFDLTHRHFLNQQTLTNFHQLECSEQTNTMSMIFKLGDLPYPSINYALQKMLNGGSQAYPIRNLIQSVKPTTFNNVLYTSTINEDYMMFNFSSPILQDYKHLLRVYHDMVFRPLLRKQNFEQLVWRYEFEQKNRRKLRIRGDLANIMGQNQYYEQNFLYRQIQRNFFNRKNATICNQQDLIDLNYEKLIKYYKQVINMKNLTLINHGDMSAEYVLSLWNNLCEENIKKQQQKPIFILKNQSESSSPIINQQQLYNKSSESFPKTISFEHMKPQTIFMLSFKLLNVTQQERACLSILSYILFDMPQSPFMRFNTVQTPYPLLYGYKNRYFNVGITFNDFNLSQQQKKLTQSQNQKIMIQKQRQIFNTLQQLVKNKLANSLIQKCLAHLESNYYTQNGIKIIQSIIDPILNNQSIQSSLNVTQLIQKLFKKYRKQHIFENLIQKFLLSNQQYICFRGYNNYQVVQNKQFKRQQYLSQIQKKLSDHQINSILSYQPPNILQDLKSLPELKPIDLQFFQDQPPKILKIDNVNVYYLKQLNNVKITFKSDISDLDQELYPFLQLFCKSFSHMGTKHMKDDAYQQIMSRYITNIDVRYQTQKSLTDPDQMKVFLFITVDFNDRYFQYGFSILNGLVKGWNHQNIFALSKIIQKSASQCFHAISQDVISFHAKHLAASKSPFAFFESPIFNSRSITGMAGDLRKVTNPKQILNGISYQLLSIYQKVFEKQRIQILFECKQNKKDFYTKYISLLIKQLSSFPKQGPIQGITISNFPQQRWLKYFPNFQQQLVFQCFKFPYYQKKSAAGLIFSSIVNKNILQYNKLGGSFLYKGTLVTFIAGGRKKVLELEDYYRKIESLDQAKRDIFKRFGRYTVKQWFQSGISFEQARFFKQAIIATQKSQIQQILNEFILQVLKKGESSILSLGPMIQNYEPLLKKGWQIQRPVDDLSLNVQSYSSNEAFLRVEDYTKIC